MNKSSLALFAAFAIASIGCTHQIGHFSVVTTEENVDWSRKNEFMLSNEIVSGDHYVRYIVGVVTGAYKPELEVATKDALKKIPGAVAIVDADFTRTGLWAVMYAHDKYVVKGRVLIDPARVNQQAVPPMAMPPQEQQQYQYPPQQAPQQVQQPQQQYQYPPQQQYQYPPQQAPQQIQQPQQQYQYPPQQK